MKHILWAFCGIFSALALIAVNALPASAISFEGYQNLPVFYLQTVNLNANNLKDVRKSVSANSAVVSGDINNVSIPTSLSELKIYSSGYSFKKGDVQNFLIYIESSYWDDDNSVFAYCPTSTSNYTIINCDLSMDSFDRSSVTSSQNGGQYSTSNSIVRLFTINLSIRFEADFSVSNSNPIHLNGTFFRSSPKLSYLPSIHFSGFYVSISVLPQGTYRPKPSDNSVLDAIKGGNQQAHDDAQEQLNFQKEQENQQQSSVENVTSDANSSQSDVKAGTSSLLSVITSFVGSITSASATSCKITMSYANYFNQPVDLCGLDPPAPITALLSIVVALMVFKLAKNVLMKIINLIRSFQS